MKSTETPSTGSHTDGGTWLSTREAAAWLLVTPKTIRRRIERGELEARKVSRDGGGIVWLVRIGDERDTGKDTEHPRKGQRNGHTEREKDGSTPSERDTVTDMGVEQKGHEKDADLWDEVRFLRGVIEQLQRDGAETRAALRAALKLTAEASVPQLTAGAEPIDTKEETGAAAAGKVEAARVSPPPPRSKKSLTYSDIADEIEQRLGLK
jgi:hypothetical protein